MDTAAGHSIYTVYTVITAATHFSKDLYNGHSLTSTVSAVTQPSTPVAYVDSHHTLLDNYAKLEVKSIISAVTRNT